MRVTFRVDASPLMGGGHVLRCLALADALALQGAKITFVSGAMPDAIAQRIVEAGHELVRIAVSSEPRNSGADWHEHVLDAEAQAADFTATSQAGIGDWVVVDHYLLDRRWHSLARDQASVLVIDDLANRPCDPDLLLDTTLGRQVPAYRGLVPSGARLLLGSLYALLRPEFEAEREAALNRRKSFEQVRRILVSMGTTDLGGISAKVVDAALKSAPDCAFDVVIGAAADSLNALAEITERDRRVTLHVDTREIAQLMREADLAIGAAGTTSWERCCLGLPSIVLVLAENQRASAKALADAETVIALDRPDEIAPVLRSLTEEPESISRMSAAAFAIVDGRGAERVASAMLGKNQGKVQGIQLRPATLDDAELLWLWRNEPSTRAASRNTEVIPWRMHQSWLTNVLGEADRKIFIAEEAAEPIGTVGLGRVEDGTELSITVAPHARGRGVGQRMLAVACEQVSGKLVAAVRQGNVPSQRLFESCSFRRSGNDEPGFVRYLRAGEVLRKHA